MSNRHDLTDEDWERVAPLLPPERGRPGRPATDNRCMLNATVWILITGAPWRDLPECYPNWKSVHTRLTRWTKMGLWQQVLAALNPEPDGETYSGDSTSSRAHQHAAGARGGSKGQAIGVSRGGPTTKLHGVVDGLGNPVKLLVGPGNEHDMDKAPALVGELRDANVVLDKGYDSDALRAQLEGQNCVPVIPPRKNRVDPRPYDKHIYKERHLIENFWEKIKRNRRVATRYEKLASHFLAFALLASILVLLA